MNSLHRNVLDKRNCATFNSWRSIFIKSTSHLSWRLLKLVAIIFQCFNRPNQAESIGTCSAIIASWKIEFFSDCAANKTTADIGFAHMLWYLNYAHVCGRLHGYIVELYCSELGLTNHCAFLNVAVFKIWYVIL